VVADEVRKLAEKSARAADEIARMITAVQQGAQETSDSMRMVGRDVAAAAEHTDRMRQSFAEIIERTNASAHGMGDIQEAAHGMNTARETLHTAILHAGGVAEGNLTSAARAAERNRQLMQEMDRLERAAALNGEASGTMADLDAELHQALGTSRTIVERNAAVSSQMAQQSSAVMQVVDSMASISEENSAAVEEVSAATEEMSAQAREVASSSQMMADMARQLEEVVSRFKLTKEEGTAEEVEKELTADKEVVEEEIENIVPFLQEEPV